MYSPPKGIRYQGRRRWRQSQPYTYTRKFWLTRQRNSLKILQKLREGELEGSYKQQQFNASQREYVEADSKDGERENIYSGQVSWLHIQRLGRNIARWQWILNWYKITPCKKYSTSVYRRALHHTWLSDRQTHGSMLLSEEWWAIYAY